MSTTISADTNTTVTVKDLRKIKGLGPTKAQTIKGILDSHESPTDVTIEELASIQGISTRTARQVVQEVLAASRRTEADSDERQEAPKRKKTAKAKARVTAKSTKSKATSNGNGKHVERTAGDVRRFANEAEAFGLTDLATSMREQVCAKLDDETITLNN